MAILFGSRLHVIIGPASLALFHFIPAPTSKTTMAAGRRPGTPCGARAIQRFVQTTTRNRKLPDVPTFIEQGFDSEVFALDGYIFLAGPIDMPQEIVERPSGLMSSRQTRQHRYEFATLTGAKYSWRTGFARRPRHSSSLLPRSVGARRAKLALTDGTL
jgi:hypothetical protein